MDQTEIERMAREAGAGEIHGGSLVLWQSQFTRFAALVRAKARAEAMAECADIVMNERVDFEATGSDEDEAYNLALTHAFDAIRAAAQKERSESALQAMADDAQRLGLDY